MIKFFIGLLRLLPFGTLTILFLFFGWGLQLEKYHTTLVILNITIAIFAINFSFLVYQLSPYRVLIHPAYRRHRWYSIILLAFVLLPLMTLVIAPRWTGLVALTFLPVVAYASILLGILASQESRGTRLLKSKASLKRFEKFLPILATDYDRVIYEQEQQRLSSQQDTPIHELRSKPIPPPLRENDPVYFSTNLAFAALINNDLNTFDLTIQRIIQFYSVLEKYKLLIDRVEVYKVSSALQANISGAIERIIQFTTSNDKSSSFMIRLQEQFAHFVRSQAKNKQQQSISTRDVCGFMVVLGKNLLERNLYDSALLSIIVAREAAQKGIDDPPKDELLFEANLDFFVRQITEMGKKTVQLRNTDFLYRCLDALCWLGCSAVRKKQYPVTLRCLEGLVQLGRESRAEDLRCFWSRCALRPEDHAEQRLKWISTWIASSTGTPPDRTQEPFALKALAEAYSRFFGKECKAKLFERDGKCGVKIEKSDKPYRISFTEGAHIRTIDYFDPKMTDEFDMT